ncbi:MAG: DegT/DnrJ/EryC1/StrS family aminotransferase [Planctomycetota bacterium]|nr:MAG: DegT/DnrJ/EryC1/StrS family aminotransferase [Planctomycetota bacterium]
MHISFSYSLLKELVQDSKTIEWGPKLRDAILKRKDHIWFPAIPVQDLLTEILKDNSLPSWLESLLSQSHFFTPSLLSLQKGKYAEENWREDFFSHVPKGFLIEKASSNLERHLGVKEYLQISFPASEKALPFLDLQEEYLQHFEEWNRAVQEVFTSCHFILGPQVSELEKRLCQYLDISYAIGTSSGTEALVIALRSLAIVKKGKEFWDSEDLIITTPFTFTATGDAILRAGATPVFLDIDEKTYNLCPQQVEDFLKKEGKKVVALLPVHLYGLSAPMDDLMNIAQKYNLFVVEDVAQAFGGKWKDKFLGTLGDLGCFSFFPSKNLGGAGDGGMVVTHDKELADVARMLIRHGGKDKYNVDHVGYNGRLDTLQASLLLAKLPYIDHWNERRRNHAHIYHQKLVSTPLRLPSNHKLPAQHVFHQYTVQAGEWRNQLQAYLKEKGIPTMVYYPVPLHKMKVFQNRSFAPYPLKNAEKACQEVLSLPIGPFQQEEQTLQIAEEICDFFSS